MRCGVLAALALVACAIGPASADPASGAREEPPVTATAVAPAARTRRDIVIDALRKNLGGADRLYVAPRIPEAIESNTRAAANLSPSDELLGVADRSIARNGKVGLFFLADRIVQIRTPTGPVTIYYEQLSNVTPREGLYVLHYGDVMLDGQAIGKDRVRAIVAEILAGLAANPQP